MFAKFEFTAIFFEQKYGIQIVETSGHNEFIPWGHWLVGLKNACDFYGLGLYEGASGEVIKADVYFYRKKP